MVCPTSELGITFDCNPDGSGELVIDTSVPLDTPALFAYVDAPLSIRNAGEFEFFGGGTFLTLMGTQITYRGDGASISSLGVTAMAAYASGAGLNSFVLDDTIAAEIGLYVDVSEGSPVEIDMVSGAITATTGITVNQAKAGRVDIAVRRDARIEALIPIQVANDGTTRVVVAGTLSGMDGSRLGEGDTELELQPGFSITGPVDGLGGTNTLVWGGSGTERFSLDRIGSHVVDDAETGQFLGFRHFRKAGSSNWTVFGTLSDAAALSLESGTLTLDGARIVADLLTVGPSARLAGHGDIGDLDVFGALVPRGSLFADDVIFHPGSLFEVTASNAGTDVLRVASVGDLSGTTLQVIPSAGYLGGRPVLVTETALATDNRFTAVQSTTPRYRPELTYEEHSILLDLVPTGASFAGFAKTPTETAIAELLDAMGPSAPYYDMLDTMAPDDVSRLLAQLAGTDLAVTGDVLLQHAGLVDTTIISRLQQQAGMLGTIDAPLGYASFSTTPTPALPTGAWGKLVAGTASSSSSASGATSVFGGIDTTLPSGPTVGVLAGFGQSAVQSGLTTANSTDLSIGTYAAANWADLHLRLGTSLTNHGVASSRRIQSPGIETTLTANYSIVTAQLFAELAQQLDLGPLTAELFGDLAYARNFTSAYSEQGGAGALSVAANTSDAIETNLGVRFSKKLAFETTLVTLTGSLAWKHRLASNPGTVQSFSASPAFAIPGTATTSNALVAGLDVHLDQSEQVALDVSYRLELGDSGTAQTISAKYAYLF